MWSQAGLFDVFDMANNIAYYAEGRRLHMEVGRRQRGHHRPRVLEGRVRRPGGQEAREQLSHPVLDPSDPHRSCDWNT